MVEARVESHSKTVIETVERVIAVTDFVLIMTEDEAKELLAVTGALAPYFNSAKGPTVTSSIYHKLHEIFTRRGFTCLKRRCIHMDGIKPTWT